MDKHLSCIQAGGEPEGDDLGCKAEAVVKTSAEQLHDLLDTQHRDWKKKTGLVEAWSKDSPPRKEWVLRENKKLWERSSAKEVLALAKQVPAYKRERGDVSDDEEADEDQQGDEKEEGEKEEGEEE